MSFSNLKSDTEERLAILLEEMGEAQQIIGKILRHGLRSSHPHFGDVPNIELLEKELGHVLAVIDLMVRGGELRGAELKRHADEKIVKLREWTHHQIWSFLFP